MSGLSFGGSYKLTRATSVDLAYTHVFVDDATSIADTTDRPLNLKGSVDASTDICRSV